MKIKIDAWKCELCQHIWLALTSEPPSQCAKCRKRGWHTVTTSQTLPAKPVTLSQKSNPIGSLEDSEELKYELDE